MKTRFFRRAAAVCVLFVFLAAGLWAVDVTIVSPTITVGATTYYVPVVDLESYANQIASDPDIQKYTQQPDFAQGFADTGSASAYSGLFRSPYNYKIFSIAYGFGAAITMADSLSLSDYRSGNIIENENDTYAGIALHPFNLSAGINLGFLVSGLRANVKFGYFDLSAGTLTEEYYFETKSFGGGLTYQLVKPKSVPLGVFKWQGLNISSGLYYQKTTVETKFVPDDAGFTSAVTLGAAVVDGYLAVVPELSASIESSTFTVPIEATTGVRLLYILDLMIGAGVDLTFGSGEITMESNQQVAFVYTGGAVPTTNTPGRITITSTTKEDAKLVRPRIMAGIGFGAGPVRFEVPFSISFSEKGNTYVTGINAGIVF